MSQPAARKIIVGTRGSDLAMTQSTNVVESLRNKWPEHEFIIKIVKTTGDRIADKPVEIIGTGIFTTEIEKGLLKQALDIAIHSLKDLPTQQPEGLVVAAIPEREDPRDVLVSKKGEKLSDLPEGARIGTGSPRRAAQLLAFRNDFVISPIRGNVPTRLKRLMVMPLDAIVLAAAGLRRLGLEDSITEYIEPEIVLPAPGQGLLGIEARLRDNEIIDIVVSLEDAGARIEALAERQLLELLGGGCQAPVGALATVKEKDLELRGAVVSLDGKKALRASCKGEADNWREVTWKVAQELKSGGAQEIIDNIRSKN